MTKKIIPALLLGTALLTMVIEAKQFRARTVVQDSASVLSTVNFQGPTGCYPLPPPCVNSGKKKPLKEIPK